MHEPTQHEMDALIDTTYTIRRLGCTSWADGLPAHRVAEELRHADAQVPGHVAIADSGPNEGEIVDVASIEEAVREAS